jgi:hypothetical protein
MKKLWMLAVVVAAVALFATCSLLKVSIDECISNFMSDINSSDRSNVYTTLDSSTPKYNTGGKAASYWDGYSPVGYSYTLVGKTTSGSSVDATISSPGGIDNSWTIHFGMSTDSDGNAVISTIILNGNPIFN